MMACVACFQKKCTGLTAEECLSLILRAVLHRCRQARSTTAASIVARRCKRMQSMRQQKPSPRSSQNIQGVASPISQVQGDLEVLLVVLQVWTRRTQFRTRLHSAIVCCISDRSRVEESRRSCAWQPSIALAFGTHTHGLRAPAASCVLTEAHTAVLASSHLCALA